MESVTKDPQAVLAYGFDWADGGANDGASTDTGWLQGDTIASSSWSVTGPDAALTSSGEISSATATSVELAAGTVGRQYKVTNHITTASGYEDDRTIIVTVAQK